MPAAPGEAMLVPEEERTPQLSVVASPSFPAERMPTPGIVTSGLMRPSAVGPQLLKLAIEPALSARSVAPTETALLAVEGLDTEPAAGPELPAAKKIRKSLWFHMNSSTSWLAAE